MSAPSDLDLMIDGKPFRADATVVSYADASLPVEEVTTWTFEVHMLTINNNASWSAYFKVEGADNRTVKTKFTARSRTTKGKRLDCAGFREWHQDFLNYAAVNLSPNVARRMTEDVLAGQTVELKNGLSLSRRGLTRREGGMFRKTDVTYPWSDYEGCDGPLHVLFRARGKTVAISTASGRSQTGHYYYKNHGAMPILFRDLALYCC
jgi:hypothetical protein